MLYGPLWFKGQVAKVDVDKAELTVVADGFKIPAAVNFDSKGNLWVVDTALGQLVRVDPKTGAKKMVAQLKPSLDNLAIDDKDRIFVSNMADNGIQEVDPETGAAKQVIIGKLALPGGIGVVSDGAKDTIYVADVFAYRTVDGATGEVSEPARMHADGVTLEYPMSATAKGDDVHPVELVHRHGAGDRPQDRQDRSRCCTTSRRRTTPSSSATAASSSTSSAASHWFASAASTARTARWSLAASRGRSGWSADSKGDVYVTEAFAGQVSLIESNGEKTVIAKDLKMPEGIALTPDGNLIVAEVGAKRIVQIDPVKRNRHRDRRQSADRPRRRSPADCRPTSRPASASAHPG